MINKTTFRNLGLGSKAAENLANTGNFGLSQATWSNYKTAEKMLLRCSKDTGKKMELPLAQSQILFFIDWLIRARDTKHGTICSYLAGLRQLHIACGHDNVKIRTDLVNLVLTGKRNQETLKKKGGEKGKRLPVTITVMKLIKAALRDCNSLGLEEKLLTWAVSCLAFNGALRIHELLCKEENKFDPRTTLLSRDIKIVRDGAGKKDIIVVSIKWPKEDRRGTGTNVEIFETGSELCPAKALRKWWKLTGQRKDDMPAFMTSKGRAWTGKRFNETLKMLLKKHFDYSKGTVTSHSFRIGVTTTLGQAGYNDKELKEVGRWSSRAFESYVKLPRTKRRELAREISKLYS